MQKILLVVLIFIVTACAQVPITGRSQLSLVSNDEIMSLSADEYKKVVSSSKTVTTGEYAQMVNTVGQNIKTSVEKYMNDNGLGDRIAGFNWEFNLIDEPTVNAWCMPGGKVAFYTGIMPLCQNEVGVAVVMGHEVAHAIANHGAERMSQAMALQFGVATLETAMGQDPSTTQQIFLQSIGISSQVGILSFSRKHESEADKMGLIFMSMAGYDPREAPKFWERMSANSSGQPPEWLSTHPSHERRIQDLNENMPEALKYYKP